MNNYKTDTMKSGISLVSLTEEEREEQAREQEERAIAAAEAEAGEGDEENISGASFLHDLKRTLKKRRDSQIDLEQLP